MPHLLEIDLPWASRGGLTAADRVAFASVVLDAGARLDVPDRLLKSTPLGWACRWGRIELVRLFMDRGGTSVEADAESWATPRAWAEKMNRRAVLAELRKRERVSFNDGPREGSVH